MKKTAFPMAVRLLALVLCLAGLFTLHGCLYKKAGHSYVSRIIDNYAQYEQQLSEKAINIAVEEAAKQPELHDYSDDKVLTVTSAEGDKYIFYTIDELGRYGMFDGDVCQIYLTDYTSEERTMTYELSILFEFRSDMAYTVVSYENDDRSNFGTGVITYYSGNFMPDSEDLSLKQQRTDRWIKSWVSAEELSGHYRQAHEYYDLLCSALKQK